MFFKTDSAEGSKKKDGEPKGRTYPLLPLRDIIVFPYSVIPLYVGREKSITALEETMKGDRMIVMAAQRQAKTNDPQPEDIHQIGTLSHVLQLLRTPDRTVKVLVEGRRRVRIGRFHENDRFFEVEAEPLDEIPQMPENELRAVSRSVVSTFENYVKVSKRVQAETVLQVSQIEDAARLADTVVQHLQLKLPDRQSLLEIIDPAARLQKILELMTSEIEIVQLERKIKTNVKKSMERSQRDYYLNEQMRAIQKELGDRDEFKNEFQEIEEKIKAKEKFLTEEGLKKINKELKKLKMMSPMSAEATVVRTYIDWILSLPWKETTEDRLDLKESARVLDEDHYGLEKVKDRILEYLAVLQLTKEIKGPILCLVGPPGVGKTSLGRSIARSMNRQFIRVSLGGVRDEAEIRGHRRTYIGAMPGKIIQSLKKAGSSNPVFLLDEIEKMSSDFRGDPASAMLEVLDPEQNNTFNDHYLDLDYDLSKVLFIATANSLQSIPAPLLDRMEVIRVPGYTEQEKLEIARTHLVAKQLKNHGLDAERVEFSPQAITEIIRYYTREAGVRSLEREIGSICRKVARRVVEEPTADKIKISPAQVEKFLGVKKYRYGRAEEENQIGLTTGLAWTEVGGELLQIEVSTVPGKGKITITGKLGEVMQESAQAALSYVRSRAAWLGIADELISKTDTHVHVPEGATPKDGPSAGIALATSLASAFARIPVRADVAMTGEITLRGRVLPIGGLKEKILAAHRGGIKTVLIPKENEKDLADIPKPILKAVTVIPVETMDEVIAQAFVEQPKPIIKGSDTAPVPEAPAAKKDDAEEEGIVH